MTTTCHGAHARQGANKDLSSKGTPHFVDAYSTAHNLTVSYVY